MQKGIYKIPIIILTLTIIGCILFAISLQSSKDTWNEKKIIYKNLIELIGNISANSNSVEELKKLKPEFDRYYEGEMIFAEANHPELLQRMMILRKDYENQILGRIDYYQTDKLKQSCQKLIKQLSETISYEESLSNLKIFTPLAAGIVILIGYFFYIFWLRKYVNRKIHAKKFSQERIEELKLLVGTGNTEAALKKLYDILKDTKSSKLDDFLLIQSQFNNTQRDKNLNILEPHQARGAIAKINKTILDFLNELSE